MPAMQHAQQLGPETGTREWNAWISDVIALCLAVSAGRKVNLTALTLLTLC